MIRVPLIKYGPHFLEICKFFFKISNTRKIAIYGGNIIFYDENKIYKMGHQKESLLLKSYNIGKKVSSIKVVGKKLYCLEFNTSELKTIDISKMKKPPKD